MNPTPRLAHGLVVGTWKEGTHSARATRGNDDMLGTNPAGAVTAAAGAPHHFISTLRYTKYGSIL